MKILFCDFSLPYLIKDSQYPIGGWAVELNTWIEGLYSCGVQTGVLTWKGAAKYVGKKTHLALLDTYNPNTGLPILKYFYYYIPTMVQAARNFSPDFLIQSCSGLQTGIMAFIANKIKVPFIFRAASDMDSDHRYAHDLPLYSCIAYKYGIKNAKLILAQNKHQLKNFKTIYNKTNVYILHNPFKPNCDPSILRTRSQKKYIAWLGIFKEAKNLPLLHKVASAIPQITFCIAGMPSKNIDSNTKRALTDLKKLSNVHFVGYIKRKDVLKFLANAVALLATSHYEGFSNSFLESLFSGTPIIAPKRIDPDDIIAQNGLGETTESDSMLPTIISNIWNMDEHKYNKIAKHCQLYVMEHHNPQKKANELISILNRYKP